jgi:hypothetical protein
VAAGCEGSLAKEAQGTQEAMKFNVTRATGKALTAIAATLGLERRRFLFFFREPDFLFRKRILKYLRVRT